jgi:hypothetical protein
MDSKITLSFDETVIEKAKKFAASQNISLSRLTEFLLRKITSGHYTSLDDIPVSTWVNALAEGPSEYKIKRRKRRDLKKEFFRSHK